MATDVKITTDAVFARFCCGGCRLKHSHRCQVRWKRLRIFFSLSLFLFWCWLHFCFCGTSLRHFKSFRTTIAISHRNTIARRCCCCCHYCDFIAERNCNCQYNCWDDDFVFQSRWIQFQMISILKLCEMMAAYIIWRLVFTINGCTATVILTVNIVERKSGWFDYDKDEKEISIHWKRGHAPSKFLVLLRFESTRAQKWCTIYWYLNELRRITKYETK